MCYKAEGLFWSKVPTAVGLNTEVRMKMNLQAGPCQSHIAHSTGGLH